MTGLESEEKDGGMDAARRRRDRQKRFVLAGARLAGSLLEPSAIARDLRLDADLARDAIDDQPGTEDNGRCARCGTADGRLPGKRKHHCRANEDDPGRRRHRDGTFIGESAPRPGPNSSAELTGKACSPAPRAPMRRQRMHPPKEKGSAEASSRRALPGARGTNTVG